MSLKKQFLKSKPVCKVTFSLTKDEANAAEKVQLLGEFNQWKIEEAVELKKYKNGSFKATVDLPIENEFQFKYLIDGAVWSNDVAADKYVNNGITAEDNSVVVI
ncbi:Glycogen recognition site of AMP-activated protein kinase [Lutibacter oricola]|uniref:Glycogen recognition site of AMP-activated protein kinase n=2 Tax=Lutibacter oricola TaxID=762486 RepID=A0A1H3B3A3_9FLAO|nr:Glycogen recognition site of AMP-activated protein kinase [Lutibacter oricola]